MNGLQTAKEALLREKGWLVEQLEIVEELLLKLDEVTGQRRQREEADGR